MKLLVELFRNQPGAMSLMLLCLVVAGLAEGVGLSAMLPLVTLASGGGSADGEDRRSQLERMVGDAFERVGVELTLESILVVVVAAFLLRGGVSLAARAQIGFTVAAIVTDMRMRLVSALMASSWPYYVQQRVGTFSNSYTTEARRAGKVFMEGTLMASRMIETLVYLAVALATSWRVTLSSLVVGAFVLLVLGRFVRMSRNAGVKQTKLFSFMSERLTDVLQGVKPLKAMHREGLVAPMLEKGTLRMEKAIRKEFFSREAIAALQEPLLIPFLALGVIAGVRWLDMQFSTVLVLGMVALRAIGAMNKVQRRYQKLQVHVSAYHSALETIGRAEEARERLHGGAEPVLEQGIELRDVSLRHGERDVLRHLSLPIPFGRITALSGPSGGGKTTIADLAVGLVEADAGDVLVDGRPLSEIDLAKWRDKVGYVPQEMFLLHDTVELNVSLGDPSVSRVDVERALRAAHAWDFVSALPEGLETVVGERGSALSGGQRQRIAIARALLHRPWLLILDEATAALDPESEEMVWSAVEELRGETTVLAVSHQPALLEVADFAWRIEDGVAYEMPTQAAPAAAEGGS